MEPSESFNTDELLEYLGGCGRFQVLLEVIISISAIPGIFSYLISTVGFHNPGWRCMDNFTFPSENWTVYTPANVTSAIINGSQDFNDQQTLPEYRTDSCQGFDSCQHIEFSPEAITFVTEWGLTCNRAWILSTILAIKKAGNMCSTALVGYVGDRFGRKRPVLVTRIILSVLTLISMFSVSWQMFAVMNFLIGLNGSFGILEGIIATEYVVPKWRVRVNSLPFWTFIFIIFAFVAMFIRNWKTLNLITAVLGFMTFFVLFWLPESMRWFSIRGKDKKTLKMARKVARINKAEVPREDLIDFINKKNQESQKNDKSYSILNLFRKGYRTSTFVIGFIVLSADLIYTSFSFGITAMPGNMFTNLIIFAVCDLPANIISFTVANMFPRRPSMFISLFIQSLCIFGAVALDLKATGDLKVIGILVLVVVAKMFLYVCWIVLYTVMQELYPTVVRSTFMSYTTFMSHIGGICAPYLIPSEPSTFYICYLAMAILTLVCAAMIILLPETKGVPLKDTWEIHQKEKIQNNDGKDEHNRVV